jgi:hypothetical protein
MAELDKSTVNDTGYIQLPVGTTAQQPGKPGQPAAALAQIRFNSSEGYVEFYNGTIWKKLGSVTPISATGGTITEDTVDGTLYRFHAFTSAGNSTFTVTDTGSEGKITAVIVAGGGGGGNDNAGGGGAGGVILLEDFDVSIQGYTINVGNGGAFNGGEQPGSDGQSSSAFGQTAVGGGGGGGGDGGQNGRNGGSGGGAGGEGQPNTGGQGTPGQGFNGGREGAVGDGNGGGGGGAGGVGGNAGTGTVSQSGNGGIGRDLSIYFGTSFGENGYFGGGGAGAVGNGPTGSTPPAGFGNGGLGGGGDHGKNAVSTWVGEQGTDGTGGGGGGGAYTGSGYANPGRGGRGIVIIRYPI